MRVLGRSVFGGVVAACMLGGGLVFGAPVALASYTLVGSFGEEGAGAGQFRFVEPETGESEPVAGVAVSNATGEVYVADTGNGRVQVFTSAGAFISEFTGSGSPAGSFTPTAIAIDNSISGADPSKGDVYVLDTARSVIDKFDSSGTYLGQIVAGREGVAFGAHLRGLAVDPEGTVWVYQAGGEVANSKELDSYTDAVINAFAASCVAPYNTSPTLAVNSNKGLYIGAGGSAIAEISGVANGSGECAPIVEPGGIAPGLPGRGAAVDSAHGNTPLIGYLEGFVVKYTEANTEIERFGEGQLPTAFPAGPRGIAVNENTETVYVADNASDKVYIFTSKGRLLHVEKAGNGNGEVTSTPAGIACGSKCAVDFEEGQTVLLKQTPQAGSEFNGWEGCDAEPGGECEVTLSTDRTVKATYTLLPQPPLIEAQSAETIGQSTATLTGTLNPERESVNTCAFQYALEEALLSSGPSLAECVPAPAELGSGNTGVGVTAKLEGLAPNTTYYYRLTATNNTGPAQGQVQQLLTLPNPPIVQSTKASEITPYTAVISGSVNPGATGHAAQDDTTYQFQYSTDETFTNHTTITDAGEGTSPVPVRAQLENLEPGTTYHYRVLASNDNDQTPQTITSQPATFTTIPTPPIIAGVSASQITQTSALIAATLQTQGLPTRWELQLATSPQTLEYKTAGNSTNPESEPVGAQLESLQPNTTYYYKLTATNPDGTTETTTATFTTLPAPAPTTIATSPTSGYPILGVPPNIFPTTTVGPPPAVHPLARKQKRALALKACRKKRNRHKRALCEHQARRQ